jgi:hypothetical protein
MSLLIAKEYNSGILEFCHSEDPSKKGLYPLILAPHEQNLYIVSEAWAFLSTRMNPWVFEKGPYHLSSIVPI